MYCCLVSTKRIVWSTNQKFYGGPVTSLAWWTGHIQFSLQSRVLKYRADEGVQLKEQALSSESGAIW